MNNDPQNPNLDEELPAAETGTETPETQMPEEESIPGIEEEMLKWRDTALRTAAEYDNYRKRMGKEREECIRYANQRLMEELLPVIDNFEMGMQATSADTSSMIYIGMSMVQKQLDSFLADQGVSPIDAEPGTAFDHNLHEAIQRETSDQPEGTILRVIRKGYRIKDRLLRPANVVVAHNEQQAGEQNA